jgi:hypothetical protein
MHINGRTVYTSVLMVDTIEVEEQLTFRQRWIEPLLHGITMPFQPWVKTRMVTKNVPSRAIYETPQGFIMHPAMLAELKRAMQSRTEDAAPPFRCAPPGKGQ